MESNKGCGIGTIAVIVLLAIALFVFDGFWKILLIGVAVVAALLIALIVFASKKQRDKVAEKATETGNISEKIAVYRKMLSELMHYYYNIKDKEVKQRLKSIETATSKMIEVVRGDARDLDKAGRFIRTSLDGATRMMKSYRQLEKAPDNIDAVSNAKADAVRVLDKIIASFALQTKRLYENDVLSMDVETEVLEKTLDEYLPDNQPNA